MEKLGSFGKKTITYDILQEYFNSVKISVVSYETINEPLQMIFNKTFKEGTLPEV